MVKKTLVSAESLLSVAPAERNVSLQEVDEAFSNIAGAITIAYPEGLPEYDPVKEIIDGTEEVEGAVRVPLPLHTMN